MNEYYLYFFTPSGRFISRETLRAFDDKDAMAQAGARHGDLDMELWLRGRRIQTFRARTTP